MVFALRLSWFLNCSLAAEYILFFLPGLYVSFTLFFKYILLPSF